MSAMQVEQQMFHLVPARYTRRGLKAIKCYYVLERYEISMGRRVNRLGEKAPRARARARVVFPLRGGLRSRGFPRDKRFLSRGPNRLSFPARRTIVSAFRSSLSLHFRRKKKKKTTPRIFRVCTKSRAKSISSALSRSIERVRFLILFSSLFPVFIQDTKKK